MAALTSAAAPYKTFGLHNSALSSDILAITEVSTKAQSGATQSLEVVWEAHCFMAAASLILVMSFGMQTWDGMVGAPGFTGATTGGFTGLTGATG
jgi:hypothetical protein